MTAETATAAFNCGVAIQELKDENTRLLASKRRVEEMGVVAARERDRLRAALLSARPLVGTGALAALWEIACDRIGGRTVCAVPRYELRELCEAVLVAVKRIDAALAPDPDPPPDPWVAAAEAGLLRGGGG